MSLSLILIFVISFLLFKYILKKRENRFTKLASQLPGPFTPPIFGNNLNFLFPGRDGLVGLQRRYYRKYGPLYRVWLGNQLWIGLSNPDDIKVVFGNSKGAAKSSVFDPHKVFWGNGVSFKSGNEWRVVRKRLQPYFTKEVVASFLPKINKSISDVEKMIRQRWNGQEFDITPIISYLVLNTITYMEYDFELEGDVELASNYVKDIEKVFSILRLQIYLPFLQTKILNYFMYNLWLNKIRDRLQTNTNKFIRSWLHRYEEMTETDRQKSEVFLNSFLSSSYISLEKEQNQKLLIEDIHGVAAPATMTFTRNISFFLLMIAMHKDVQDKIIEEMNRVIRAGNHPVEAEDLLKLTYLDQVIKECHRVFVFSTILWKELERDTKIAGTGIMINVGNLHLNPQFYPDPYKFNPENFAAKAVEKRLRYCFLPYGAGSRSCLGMNFADVIIKVTVVTLLKNYTFHTSSKMEDIKLNYGFTTQSRNGCWVQFKSRI